MCIWFLPGPFFEMMRSMRKTSKKVETTDDLEGFTELEPEDQKEIEDKIRTFWDTTVTVTKAPPKKRVKKDPAAAEEGGEESSPQKKVKQAPAPKKAKSKHARIHVIPLLLALPFSLSIAFSSFLSGVM